MLGKPYKVVNDQWVELTEGPYEGIVYQYGRVQLIEEDDHLRIKFEYKLPGGAAMPADKAADFIQYIGPILTELIEDGVMNNSIVYTGGTNAD